MGRLIDEKTTLQRFIQETEDSGKDVIHINTIKRLLQDIDTAYDVDKGLNEIETKIYKDAVCIGCGYLKDNVCTYKGSACGVSKPMLENIKRVFENIRKGDE